MEGWASSAVEVGLLIGMVWIQSLVPQIQRKMQNKTNGDNRNNQRLEELGNESRDGNKVFDNEASFCYNLIVLISHYNNLAEVEESLFQ